MNIKELSNEKLIRNLKNLVGLERKTTGEILEYIKEVDLRRLYLSLGHTSLFSYLTKGLKYSPASAQRRIESARLMRSVPELSREISEGSLNLMQISLLAQGLREQQVQLEKNGQVEMPGGFEVAGPLPPLEEGLAADRNVAGQIQKRELLAKIKGLDIAATQIVLAKELNIQPKFVEKKRLQKDKSLRLELTLNEEQQMLFNRVKELISHVNPNPTWAELFEIMAKDSLKSRDPVAKVSAAVNRRPAASKMEAVASQKLLGRHRQAVSAGVKRIVFQRDQCCQWRDPITGQKCGSRFQLQLDHKMPVRNCGSNEANNLQLMCGAHNRHKFRWETGFF